MRELTIEEWDAVTGGMASCSSEGSGNELGGVNNSEKLGDDLVNIYEGLVAAASHIIERVANAL